MSNFWDFSVWSSIMLVSVLLISLLVANALKKSIRFLRESLIPTSVLGGIILLVISYIYEIITGTSLFNTGIFNYNGQNTLEIITYHCLALGFIATAFRPVKQKFTKERTKEIFNTGVTTVATYLLQGIFGLGITIVAALFIDDFFAAAGILLPFGYGQGTGQALNYGTIYETEYGFICGKSFGLTIAALGFLSASIGGVIHLNILRKKNKISVVDRDTVENLNPSDIQSSDEIPMNGSMDKLTVQLCFVVGTYLIAYVLIYVLSALLPGFKSVLYGFNFLFGVLIASAICFLFNFLRKKRVIKKQYLNTFLMNRISGFFFDIMVVAGIAAIRIEAWQQYWPIMLILGVVGLVITYIYNYFIAKVLFKKYTQHQFLAMYGMLTGTASTGIILLKELDPNLESPVSDNLVYQNFPAIVFGFPIMLLATYAPTHPIPTLLMLIGLFVIMNIILFRSYIFKRRKGKSS